MNTTARTRHTRRHRALAVAMTAGVLVSMAPAAMAADGDVIEITPPDRPWTELHRSEGVISASISAADQAALRDAGYNVSVRPDGDTVRIDYTADEGRARQISGLTDSGNEEAGKFHAELGVLSMNIHERDGASPYPTMRAGEDSPYRSLAYSADPRRAVGAASISSYRHGGVEGWEEVSTTQDAYQQYSADRQAATEEAGRRGHYLPNLSQCFDVVDFCGFYIQPAAIGADPELGKNNVTSRALTDSIWVSVHSRAGIPVPSDYTDKGGHKHTFTLDTAATGRTEDALATPWRPAQGRDAQNRVLPRFELLRSWEHTNGVVALGLRSTIPVDQRIEPVAGQDGVYTLTISAVEDLDGRQWSIRTDGLESEVFAQDEQGRTVVSSVNLVSTAGQDIALRLTLRGEDESIVATPRITSTSIGGFSGARPAAQAYWEQPTYTQETEFVLPPLPEPEPPVVTPPTPRPPSNSQTLPLACSGGWRQVMTSEGIVGYIDPAGRYYPGLSRDEVNERIAASAPEGGFCPTPVTPEPPVEEPEPPVVVVPDPEPPVVVTPDPEPPVAEQPPVDVPEVDVPAEDVPEVVAPPVADEPETPRVATGVPVAEDEPEYLVPVRPETGIDGSAHVATDAQPAPSALSVLVAALMAVAAVAVYPARLVRLRRPRGRHAA